MEGIPPEREPIGRFKGKIRLTAKSDWVFFPANGDRGGLRISLANDNRMIIAVTFVIIHAPLDILRVDAPGSEKVMADLLGLLDVKTAAAVNIDGNEILRRERVDDDGTFDQRHPAGKAGFVGETRFITTKNIRRGLFFHAQSKNRVIEELITQR